MNPFKLRIHRSYPLHSNILIFSKESEVHQRSEYMRNFGHNGYEDFYGVGINGKNSEMHAAMGLCVLESLEEILLKRKTASQQYDKELESLGLTRPSVQEHCTYNYAYYPIILESEEQLKKVKSHLEENGVFPRRYFYPSLNTLPYIADVKMEVAESISKRILCLPLYFDLQEEEISKISQLMIEVLRN